MNAHGVSEDISTVWRDKKIEGLRPLIFLMLMEIYLLTVFFLARLTRSVAFDCIRLNLALLALLVNFNVVVGKL